MSSISVVGSANIDMTATVQDFPKPGETLVGGDFNTFFGGKGANQAVAASRLGGDVSFIGKVGNDSFGDEIIENFQEEKINISALSKNSNETTGVALIFVDKSGENEIVIIPGANQSVTKEYVGRNESIVSEADVAVAQLEVPMDAVTTAASISKRSRTKFILDPAPAQEIPDDLLDNLFLITPNQSETESLTGITPDSRGSAKKAAQTLHDRGVINVIITLGNQGAFLSSDAETFVSRSPEVQAKDTTGAGDVFNGALSVALCRNYGWKRAIGFACEAASQSVLKDGAQESIPHMSDVDTLIN
jgi:ribokinase